MARLVLIEDDEDVLEEVSSFLVMRGHSVHLAESLATFRALMEEVPDIDIAIIDINLTDGEGYEAVSYLRQESERTGIIILTARGGIKDRLNGLESGSDHYLVKPFSLIELGAIIDALIRRIGLEWQYDTRRKELRSPEGFTMELNVFECYLFELLCASQGDTVGRNTLAKRMGFEWAGFNDRRVDTAISRLRFRWKDLTHEALPLRTRHGLGYSFDHPIRATFKRRVS